MDEKIINEVNSINSLNFNWLAELSDGTVINQFDTGKDNSFPIVIKNINCINWFYLYSKEDKYILDLKNGFIYKNKIIQDFLEEDKLKTKKNIRLIYFRRVRRYFDNQLTKINKTVHHIVGFQYNDINNINHKIVMQIDDNNGDCILGD